MAFKTRIENDNKLYQLIFVINDTMKIKVSAEKSSVKPFPKINISICKHQNNFWEVIWVEDFSAPRDKNMYMRLCMHYDCIECIHDV